MKRAVLLMLLAFILLIAPAPAIGQQVVGVCLIDYGRYPEHWGITAGTPDTWEVPFVWYAAEVITDPNFSSPYGAYYDNYVSMFSELRHVSPVHPFSLKTLTLQIDVYGRQLSDVLVYVSLYRRIGGQDVLVWEEQRTVTNQSEFGRGRITVQPGDVVADFVVVHAYQGPIGDLPAGGFGLLVDEICVNVTDVAGTVTPDGGWTTPTATGVGGVTNTPVPTATRTHTSTPTLTRTPSPYPTLPPTKTKTPTVEPTRQPTNTPPPTSTLTPIPSATETATRTPSPTPTLAPSATYTPGGPTVTPVPSATPPIPTLGSGPFNTPRPPDSDCRDVLNPCPLFEVPRIPTLQLPSPTPISLLPGRPTAYASITMVAMATADGTRTSDQSVPWATQMSNIQDIMELQLTQTFLNMQGTPVDGANGIYEIGSQVGSLVCVARAVGESDLGRVGGLLVFLVLAIVFNFSLRVFMPIVKIVVRVVKLILTAIGAIK